MQKKIKVIRVKKEDMNEPDPFRFDIRKEMSGIRKEAKKAQDNLRQWLVFLKDKKNWTAYGYDSEAVKFMITDVNHDLEIIAGVNKLVKDIEDSVSFMTMVDI